jgi:hypothetical protein
MEFYAFTPLCQEYSWDIPDLELFFSPFSTTTGRCLQFAFAEPAALPPPWPAPLFRVSFTLMGSFPLFYVISAISAFSAVKNCVHSCPPLARPRWRAGSFVVNFPSCLCVFAAKKSVSSVESVVTILPQNRPTFRSEAKIPECRYLGPSLFSLMPAVNLGNLCLNFSMNYELKILCELCVLCG